MKIVLFITFNEVGNLNYGGGQCTTRNYNMVKKNSDDIILYKVSKKSNLSSGVSILENNFPPLRNRDIIEIRNTIIKYEINVVYIDNSSLGIVAGEIKKQFPNIKIISFFHNVEFDYVKVRNQNSIKRGIYAALVKRAEQCAVDNSNIIICLTKRDKDKIRLLYGRTPDDVIPITFKDNYREGENIDPYKSHPVGLMVGSYKPDTFKGINWFCENIANKTNCDYYIIGNGFEKVKNELETERIHVLGRIEDLSQYYQNADFVCLPILSGAGMKVKTAEALMYGKYIYGTAEAFQGYEIDCTKVGAICETPEHFIKAITNHITGNLSQYNCKSREYFTNFYSDEHAEELFAKYMTE